MKGEDMRLLRMMDGSQVKFIIPVYQRNYDWKERNCKQLFEDLIDIIKTKRDSHFFGSIVRSNAQDGGAGDFLIIDGQQRITSVSLLLLAMYNNIKEGHIISKKEDLLDIIWETYIYAKFQRDNRKLRLKPIKGDCEAYDALVFKEQDDYIQTSNITINYNYFCRRIKDLPTLIGVDEIFEAIEKLTVIDILLGKDDNPQLIFESLNSTGLDLTEADKIRNYILMGLDSNLQEKYYETYWSKIEKYTSYKTSEFIRDFLTLSTGKISSIDNVYQAFKEYAPLSNIENILKLMLEYSIIYQQIISSSIQNEKANKILIRLNHLEMSVLYPYLMAFMKYSQDANLSKEEQSEVLSILEIYIFRRSMCEVATNALNKIFSTLHNEILKKLNNETKYSSVLIFQLQNRSGSARFPKDDEFLQSFKNRNIYSMQAKNKIYLFERLENGDSKETTDIVTQMNDRQLTIEHIMPQKLSHSWIEDLGFDYERIHLEWKDNIANLTLTGYNSNYQNKTFEEKKKIENGYNSSSLRLNKFLQECDSWNKPQLEERQRILMDRALTLWAYPKTNYSLVNATMQDEVSLSEEFDFKGKSIKEFSFMGTSYKTYSWAEAFVDIFKCLYEIDSSIIYREVSSNGLFSNKDYTNTHRKIADKVYINTNNNTNTKINILKRMIEQYGIDSNELIFSLYPLPVSE